MRFVDDVNLLLSRSGRSGPGLDSRVVRESEQRARNLQAARLARLRKPARPVVVRVPLSRPIHLVPRDRR